MHLVMTRRVGRKATNPMQGLAAAFPCPEHKDRSVVDVEMGSPCTSCTSFASLQTLFGCPGPTSQILCRLWDSQQPQEREQVLLGGHRAEAQPQQHSGSSGTGQAQPGWGDAVLCSRVITPSQGAGKSQDSAWQPGWPHQPAPTSGGSFREAALITGGCWN